MIVQYGAVLAYLRRIGGAVRRHRVGLAPLGGAIVKLVRVGRDLVVRTMALRGSLMVTTAVAARTGVVGLAAHQITFEIWSFLALTLDAVAIAGQAFIGRFLGAGDPRRARAIGDRMLDWGFAAGVVAGVAVAALHTVLPPLFSGDQAVIGMTGTLLLVAAVLQPVNGLVFVLDGLLIGAGDVRYLALAMVVGMVVFVPVAAAVLVFDLSVVWLWGALGVLMATRLVTLGLRWRGHAWSVAGAER